MYRHSGIFALTLFHSCCKRLVALKTDEDLNEAEAADASREHSSALITESGLW